MRDDRWSCSREFKMEAVLPMTEGGLGVAQAERMTTRLVLDALNMAVGHRRPGPHRPGGIRDGQIGRLTGC